MKGLKQRVKEDPDEDFRYYKWVLNEWEGGFSDAETNELNKLLFNATENLDEKEFEAHKNSIYNIMVNTLVTLRDEGLFENGGNNFILGFSPSDYDNIENEIDWISRINNKANSKEFIEYRKFW